MKILKPLGIGLVVLVLTLLLVSFFLPSKVKVERTMIIKAPESVVFDQVNTLKNWEKWSPWHKIDKKMTLSYGGPASGKDASYSWKSEHDKVGNGTLKISRSEPNKLIETEMEFEGRGKGTSSFTFEPAEGGVKVVWSMESDLGANPIAKYFGLFMDGMLGPQFEQGLTDLSAVAMKTPEPMQENMGMTGGGAGINYAVEEVTTPAVEALTVKITSPVSEIGNKLSEWYPKLQAEAQKQGLKMAGAPFGIYHNYDPAKMEYEAGIPVEKKGKDAGEIKAKSFATGKALKILYKGKYEETARAYASFDKYIGEHKLTKAGAPWEFYVDDPMLVKDPAQVRTEIYYPVK